MKLELTISRQKVVIDTARFSREDLEALALYGARVKIQRAAAGVKDPAAALEARLKKAKELADGRLTSERTSANLAAAIRAARAMLAAGMDKKRVLETFPEVSGMI